MLEPSDDMEVSVVDQAPLNESPSRPRTTLNVFIAVLLAMPLAVAAAVLRDRRDPRIAATDELESELALPVLVRVPERGRSGRNLPAFKEAFRVLRAKMPFASEDGGVRAIAVTSPSAGDGRTTVTWELALAAVEAGRHAVVVELDRDDEGADEPRGPGFWDYVAGTVELDDVVAASPVDNLFFIPAGGSPSADVMQRLDGDRGRVVAESLARTADIVIFDAPPAPAHSEAITLARFADATLLVVDLAKSRRRQVDDAVRSLRTGGAYLLGCVVNRVATGNLGPSSRARSSERAPAW
jgi:succinoglycan biosynthesis transport protein ExoP